MDKFKKTGINFDEFYDFCKKVMGRFFSDYFVQGNDTVYIEGSKIMELLINYTKKSIDADINSKKSPKLLIYSAHDITISKQELFIFKSLGLNKDENYIFPTYASQIAFEITRKDDDNKNRKYSDYFVNYYFNDDLILNMRADEFINKMEPNIWSEEKINHFCGYSPSSNNSNNTNNTNNTNNSDESNNNSNKGAGNSTDENNYRRSYFSLKRYKSYKTPFIVMTSLFGASFIGNIILLALLFRKKTYIQPASSVNSMTIGIKN